MDADSALLDPNADVGGRGGAVECEWRATDTEAEAAIVGELKDTGPACAQLHN